MKKTTRSDEGYEWELLLKPGVCWYLWEEEDSILFCLCPGVCSSGSNHKKEEIEKAFPPDIAYLLHEIVRDASDMKSGESRSIRILVPGTDEDWPGHISRLSTGRYLLLWSEPGNGRSDPKSGDIKDHIRSEKASRKANEKLNLFNAIVRHDVTNLMMGITGYIDIIDEIVDNEEVHLLVRKSRDLGDRIKRIIELTRTYQDLGIRPPSLIEAESSIQRILNRHEFFGNIKTEVFLKGLFVYVDRMFDVVIYEMVRNSLQYGGEGVSIRFSYEEGSDGLVLTMQDSGPGVHPDNKERIFSRNYADRKGYGLFLAAEILDITGITIREIGTFGEYARFELLFPPDTYRIDQ